MKTKMIYTLSGLATMIAIGIGVWFVLQSKQIAPMEKSAETTPNESNITEVLKTDPPIEGLKELTPEERALKGKETFLAMMEFTGVDTENNAYWKLLHEAVNSPEYIEYQKKQDERIGIDLDLWWSFLESKGLSSGRMAQEERFREHFPTGDYADYEPEMRKRLAERFLEAGLSTTATDAQSVGEIRNVMAQFRAEDEAHRVWMRGYFNGYVGDLEWAQEIRKNAARIVAGMEDVNTVPEFKEPAIPGVATYVKRLFQKR